MINHYQCYYGTGTGAWPANWPMVRHSCRLSSLCSTNTLQPSLEFINEVRQGSAKVWYAYQIVYLLDPALIKLSILVFYLSIATHRTFRIVTYITIGFVACMSTVMILVNAFECPHKPSLALAPDIFTERDKWGCFNLEKLYFSQAGLNISTDIFILVLPLPILVKLRMPTLKRISLLLVFSIGLLVPIAAALRIWALYMWATVPELDMQRYYGGYILFWDQVEMNTAIICASAPSLQPLFRAVFGELSRFQRSRTYYFYGEGQSTMTQRTIGRRGSRPLEQDLPLESPASTYRPQKHEISDDIHNDVIVVREMDEEEEIRNRVRAFTARPPSSHSQPPKSPARPRDILASG